ncbi:holo-ACP synthase [Xanthomonas hortorum]|uniref:Holo-[acyl-carrier-protein] synthase n=2 Tax=Xanthomonas hortorum TaxID=56454 RepID=A0A6V7DE94_9XANT|nr:holo-ACP synthase [Xanthomonas hortorum]APP80623.1 holo-[acyl-carrier-protein] synthase [Xanthomonas hortorum pv. gardneri]MCC8498201.1 holo-ACP synthase [Xanthomonas hortorum pv. gardneri]MCC8509832.1 holo-ACP synthase [Xanthomonas hortorum pv. gardneri]MCC8513043.1 holo-ACP synthase [Xanthomonas hortorum pv. gardneri]MCC8518808.1 holo-ACP synthase [Xanthomonas hortorum pv. gardneri]
MTDKHQLLAFGNVVAHGVDVVDMADFSRLMNEQAGGFLDRYFTLGELATANEGGNRIERLASRFAIKEAVLKALGTGWGDGIAFTDVEVVSQRTGAPTVVLHRRLVKIADEKGIARWLVSASHTTAVAMASVIALTS